MPESPATVREGPLSLPEFASFYACHRDPIRRAIALATGDLEMAEEAVDEAMTRAISAWDKIGGYERPEGWVYRVGLNWARGRYRKRRYELLGPSDHRRAIEFEPPDVDVLAAIASLPIRMRAVVIARYYLDWSTAEVASALNLPEGTVKSRLARSLDRLSTELGEG